MISGKTLVRSCMILLVILWGITAVSAYTFQNWSAKTQTTPAQPGSPVTISYDLGFDSWMTGTTFDTSHSLVMYTDLVNPQWSVTRTEIQDDGTRIVTEIPVRQSQQVRLDGWSLSFSRKQFTLNVLAAGTVPLLNQSQNITEIRVQEVDEDAKTVSGSLIKKDLPVLVPTPVPVITASAPVPEDAVIEVTMQAAAPAGTAAPPVTKPTHRPTYSPGPDTLLICSMIAAAGICRAIRRK